MKKTIVLVLGCVVWAALVGTGLCILYDYEATPGTTPFVPRDWPQASTLSPGEKDFQLVMVAHPHCPCTRATLGELELLLAHTHQAMDVHLLFVKPPKESAQWMQTDLYKRAQNIPGVHVVIDEGGRQAELFGGTTSGQTFLFDKNGRLIFSGGITASRGHAGDNLGRTTIVSLVQERNASVERTPFFGCLLHDEEQDNKG